MKQQVVCINGGGWTEWGIPCKGPKTHEVVTVLRLNEYGYSFIEYPLPRDAGYYEKCFRPLDEVLS